MFKRIALAFAYFVAVCCAQSLFAPASAERAVAQGRDPRLQTSRGESQRIAPPEWIKCPRSHLTSYNGKVLAFRRQPGRTLIRVRTDWETTEQVVLHYVRNEPPIKWFRLNGRPFASDDWDLIESGKNELRPGMRANIWVCDDGSNPIVDWRPPAAEARP